MQESELTVLLIEDNPGDARLFEEMLQDSEELLQRVDPDEADPVVPNVRHEKRLSDGLEFLSENAADVVLLDLNLPDSTGLDTLSEMVESAEMTPVIVLTGLNDRSVGVQSIQHGAQDYLVKDDVTSDALVRSIHYAVERSRQARERRRRNKQLESLNRLNRISQDITHSVITTSSRDELEAAVCERLVESDAYHFAWIGYIDRGTNQITPQVAAGVEDGYLDDITITVDDDTTAQGPTGRAVEIHEVQVMQNAQTDPEFEPWREQAKERGYRSSAAIPIGHEDLLYGVLNVYAESANAFSEPETQILGRLGDVVGHAITAIERKDALMSDTVFQLEFQADGFAEELVRLSTEQPCQISIRNLLHSNEILTAYGTASNVSPDQFGDAIERSETVDNYRLLAERADEIEFELSTSAGRSLYEAVATHGGRLHSVTISDGEFRFLVEFPPGRDTRKLTDLVVEHCPGATLLAKRTAQQHDEEVTDPRSILETRLTEKQRTALETAYFAGHFDWPRASTGEEVAEKLDISPSTLAQHLRTAERKFFDAVFEDGADETDTGQ
ncbi:bacterio-opsin activator domain-containing protein [Halostella pelagica]|uniref:bacterio-opsin activator domain-containing protein n=1 Tax=Halostella pelagica TaxID=2583824 RepID=UPI001080E1D7|nr:bacterio-opsin activator domain-containing protein [Halostella pelagica]